MFTHTPTKPTLIQDFDPYGMLLVERNYSITSENYRFGFNAQEQDDEVFGNGNLNTAEFWSYDSRLGRRWNVDPVVKSYESSYATFSGNPILFIDLNGDKADWYKDPEGDGADYNSYKWFENDPGTEGDPYISEGKTYTYVGKTTDEVSASVNLCLHDKMMSATVNNIVFNGEIGTEKVGLGRRQVTVGQAEASVSDGLGVSGSVRVLYPSIAGPFWEGGRNVVQLSIGLNAGIGAGGSFQGGAIILHNPTTISLTGYLNEQTYTQGSISLNIPILGPLGLGGTFEPGFNLNGENAYMIYMAGFSLGAKANTQPKLEDYLPEFGLGDISHGYKIRKNETMTYNDSLNRALYKVSSDTNTAVIGQYATWLKNNLIK